MMTEARWWHRIDDGRLECFLCPRYCKLGDGKTGFCFVRQNINGVIQSLAYANPIAVNIDPIEKKPLYHFLPGSQIFSIGTAGCNLGCKFCQNWDMSKARFDQSSAKHLSPEDIVKSALDYDCKGIAFTYNEPTIFGEYVVDISKLAHQSGLKTVMVTNGYITIEALHDIYPFIDGANIDLKAFSDEFYSKMCLAHLQPVLDAIIEIKKMSTWIELTTLLVPGLNDSVKEVEKLVSWVLENIGEDVPIHFSAFHPDYKLRNCVRTPKSTLDRARNIALDAGIHYVYEGNVMTTTEGNTYCPNCKRLLIERQWFTVVHSTLSDGKCQCGNDIPIVI